MRYAAIRGQRADILVITHLLLVEVRWSRTGMTRSNRGKIGNIQHRLALLEAMQKRWR